MTDATTTRPDAERFIVTCRKIDERARSIAHAIPDVMYTWADVHYAEKGAIGTQVSYSVDLDPDDVERFELAHNLIDLVRIGDHGLGDYLGEQQDPEIPASIEDFLELAGLDPAGTELPAERVYRTGQVLDQGREGACTFFAVTNWLNAYPIPGNYDSAYAQQGYLRTKQVDEWPGTDYSGSSVEAALKVARERGKIDTWTRTRDEAAAERFFKLKSGIVWSMPWTEGMYRADLRGFIRPTGRTVGRHAIYQYSHTRYGTWGMYNSWGLDFGSRGKGWLAKADRPKLRAIGPVEAHLPLQVAA